MSQETGYGYAVIYFPNEDLFSEVPTTWLTSCRTKCWWPNKLDAKPYMKRNEKPNKADWNLHDIRVEEYCSKYSVVYCIFYILFL